METRRAHWARQLTSAGLILLLFLAGLTWTAYRLMGPDGLLAVYLGVVMAFGVVAFLIIGTLIEMLWGHKLPRSPLMQALLGCAVSAVIFAAFVIWKNRDHLFRAAD